MANGNGSPPPDIADILRRAATNPPAAPGPPSPAPVAPSGDGIPPDIADILKRNPAPPPPPPPSALGTTGAGAVQGVLGYPESVVQTLERGTGMHAPLWLRRPFIGFKQYAESTPEGQAAEFATSTLATLPFRAGGFAPGAIASTFNQPVMGNVSDPEFARIMGERAVLGSIPLAGLTPLANRLEANRQMLAQHDRAMVAHQAAVDRTNRLNTAAQRQNLSDVAARARAQQTQQAIPEAVTQGWYSHIYDGTGRAPPVNTVSPASMSAIRRDIGTQLDNVNARLRWNPQSHGPALQAADRVRQSLTTQGQKEWIDIYRNYIDPVASNRNVFAGGKDYADYLSDMRGKREQLAQRAAGQSGDSDDWKMVRGLRDIQNQIERDELGTPQDKALKQTWRQAYGRAMIGADATGATKHGMMTPESIIRSWNNHTGDYGADYATNPVKQKLADLDRLHKAKVPPPRRPMKYDEPTPPKPPDLRQPPSAMETGASFLANLPLNIGLYHLSPTLGFGHAGYWAAHHAVNQAARSAAFERALAALARNRAPVGAAIGQGLQYVDPGIPGNPYPGGSSD